MSAAIALVCKYMTRGWKDVQAAYLDKENSEEVVKVLSYLEMVEKVKHSCDETEVINLIEEHQLEREQLLTDHLKSKQVSALVNQEEKTVPAPAGLIQTVSNTNNVACQ